MKPFANEPVLELRRAANREKLLGAMRELDARLPLEVPLLIGDSNRVGDTFDSTDPGNPSRVVAVAPKATEADATAAVDAAAEAFPQWRGRSWDDRAQVLVGAAEIMRGRRLELAALAVRECGKPWAEADADVCEAIDFLEYYARQAIEIGAGAPLLQVPGERNTMHYEPSGICAVIAPWNFPIAIACGMASAALVTGNAVVLKPAEQSPACGHVIVEALLQAGAPPGAINLVTGFGDVGAALVRDPRVHTIAFTGSSAVGLEIVRTAAETPDGQTHVKRVVAEMGGKNCVIVDSDADLDEVVPAIVKSAFVYAGQKCSAAARVLAHEAVADTLIERLAGAVEVLRVGQPDEFGTDVPPVIDDEAQDRVLSYIELARREGRIAAERPLAGAVDPTRGSSAGHFCPPTLATDLPADSRVLRDEIFGPVLTVERFESIDAACDAVEASPFALTGGLFSRSPATIERVIRRSPVGNLYVNRHITGAMVARQPFGGNRRSGIGAKAGGPDYLLQFVEPHVVSENTMRHGIPVE
ncbi:MAG: RHH-type transcriptional regulator, proline utilization regulon repressor / proline dehydrogenase [Thermoleophilaceae bacterium]|nr:RHH-type transcriptional regulator, proline utilization regulon repressor / proline dehydrogenase [Thermoleophilaceae bacterium]